MIPAPFTFLEVQQEFFPPHPSEFGQSEFSEAPETLNAVDMMCALHKLITPMMDSEVLRVSDIDQTVIAAPSIGVDDGSKRNATANNGLQCGLLAVRDNLRVNASVAFEDPKDDCFTRGSAPSLATDSSSTEVALVNARLRNWKTAKRARTLQRCAL